MHREQDVEEKRAAIIAYYRGESARLELQSREVLTLSERCRGWAETARTLGAGGVEYVYGVVERARNEQALRLAAQALANAGSDAHRELVAESRTGWFKT